MTRFNQYMNGEREFKGFTVDGVPVPHTSSSKFDHENGVIIKDAKTIKDEKSKQEYDKFIKNLDGECETLKKMIIDELIGKGTFIESLLEPHHVEELKQEIKVVNATYEPKDIIYAHYE